MSGPKIASYLSKVPEAAIKCLIEVFAARAGTKSYQIHILTFLFQHCELLLGVFNKEMTEVSVLLAQIMFEQPTNMNKIKIRIFF